MHAQFLNSKLTSKNPNKISVAIKRAPSGKLAHSFIMCPSNMMPNKKFSKGLCLPGDSGKVMGLGLPSWDAMGNNLMHYINKPLVCFCIRPISGFKIKVSLIHSMVQGTRVTFMPQMSSLMLLS